MEGKNKNLYPSVHDFISINHDDLVIQSQPTVAPNFIICTFYKN